MASPRKGLAVKIVTLSTAAGGRWLLFASSGDQEPSRITAMTRPTAAIVEESKAPSEQEKVNIINTVLSHCNDTFMVDNGIHMQGMYSI